MSPENISKATETSPSTEGTPHAPDKACEPIGEKKRATAKTQTQGNETQDAPTAEKATRPPTFKSSK